MMDFEELLFGVLFTVVALVALFLVVGMPVRYIQHHFDAKSCVVFAEQSGYDTKFVDYNFLQWDCLAHRDDGKWVSRDSLRDMQ